MFLVLLFLYNVVKVEIVLVWLLFKYVLGDVGCWDCDDVVEFKLLVFFLVSDDCVSVGVKDLVEVYLVGVLGLVWVYEGCIWLGFLC